MTSKRAILFSFLALFLAGCGGGPAYVTRSNFVEFTPNQVKEVKQQKNVAYRIQEGDIFTLAFSFQKDLNQLNVVVLPDGSITLIGLDRVVVAGLTIAEADSIITHGYSQDYRDPDLSLILNETTGRQVYVLGEVEEPGLHKLPRGGLDLVGAIAVAGGFTDDAASEGSVLVRISENGYLAQEVDLSSFHSVEYAELATIKLESYDVLYVPRSRIGDFRYFSETILSGLLNMTRIAADIYYLSGTSIGRF
jgi:protein involved in polysaccharide export with SLBB domain